jgi:hypothetical protein
MDVPMTVSSPAMIPGRKPSGAVTYSVSKGANVWPGKTPTDAALVRINRGDMVIFQSFLEDDKVAVIVAGHDRILTTAEWQALPVDKG